MDSRKNLIQNQIQSLKSRAKQVVDQRQQMEHDIELVYRKALEQLHMKTEEKLLVLLSDELELHRQQKELVGAEKFLEYQQTAVDVYPLLLNWVKHQELQQKMREFGYFRDKIDVDADLKITGTLEITQSEVQYKSVKKERSQPPIAFPENTKSIPLTARRTSVCHFLDIVS